MSVLVIDYSEIRNLNSAATRLAEKFQNKIDDFEHIVSGLNVLPTSRSNLENANYFIKKKNEQYQAKINKIKLFNTKLIEFSEKSKQADNRVASRITSDTKEFKKVNEINISALVVIGDSIKTKSISLLSIAVLRGSGLSEKGLRGIKYGIKDWYRDGGKEVLKNIVAVTTIALLVVGTIVTLGALGVVVGGLSLTSMAIIGAIGGGIGLSSQLASDVIASGINKKLKFSSWQSYVGAGIGGVICGLALPILGQTAAIVIGSGSLTAIGQSLENHTGGEKRSCNDIIVNTIIDAGVGMALSKIPLKKIKGINKGRNSMGAIFKSGLTKINRGSAAKMSLSVIGKGFIKQTYEATNGTIGIGFKQYLENKFDKEVKWIKRTVVKTVLSPAN